MLSYKKLKRREEAIKQKELRIQRAKEREIKKHWDEGRHITSVAYTSNGWFVTMAKNTGFGSQYYHYGSD